MTEKVIWYYPLFLAFVFAGVLRINPNYPSGDFLQLIVDIVLGYVLFYYLFKAYMFVEDAVKKAVEKILKKDD